VPIGYTRIEPEGFFAFLAVVTLFSTPILAKISGTGEDEVEETDFAMESTMDTDEQEEAGGRGVHNL